jgi:DNA-binding transcriptional regulator YbjK
MARRRELLEAAVEVVADRGIGGATHREIAQRAGVPLSTTSYFFSSLDELLLEAMRFFTTELLARLEGVRALVVDQRLTPVEAIDALLELLLSQPSATTVAQFEAYLEATRQPEVRAEVKRVMVALERLAEAFLEAAGAARPADGARVFVALLDGFALHRVAWPRRRGERELLRAAMLDLFAAQTLTDEQREQRHARLRNAA